MGDGTRLHLVLARSLNGMAQCLHGSRNHSSQPSLWANCHTTRLMVWKRMISPQKRASSIPSGYRESYAMTLYEVCDRVQYFSVYSQIGTTVSSTRYEVGYAYESINLQCRCSRVCVIEIQIVSLRLRVCRIATESSVAVGCSVAVYTATVSE